MKLCVATDQSCMYNVRSGSSNGGNPADGIRPASAAAVAEGNSLSDISEYLRDIPLDWLSDAANLLNHTLQFNCLAPNIPSTNNSGVVDDGEVSEIVRGAKQVRVPPGLYVCTCVFVCQCDLCFNFYYHFHFHFGMAFPFSFVSVSLFTSVSVFVSFYIVLMQLYSKTNVLKTFKNVDSLYQ